MTTEVPGRPVPSEGLVRPSPGDEARYHWNRVIRRRSFLKSLGVAGAAGAALPVGVLTSTNAMAAGSLTKGDADVLRFLATAEILESDLWVQYSELGGAASPEHPTFGGNPAYVLALQNIDGDMPQYITDNTDDELIHAAFINAYLVARGAQPVDLERFRTLQGGTATGAQHA